MSKKPEDRTKLTKWPGMKPGENYARCKARLLQINALVNAFHHQPDLKAWGITPDEVFEAFYKSVRPMNGNEKTSVYFGKSSGERLLVCIENGWVPRDKGAEFILKYGNVAIIHELKKRFPELTPDSVVRNKCSATLTEYILDISKNPNEWHPEYWREYEYGTMVLIRRMFPDMISDEMIRGIVGPVGNVINHPRHKRKRVFASFLPEYKDMLKVHDVMTD